MGFTSLLQFKWTIKEFLKRPGSKMPLIWLKINALNNLPAAASAAVAVPFVVRVPVVVAAVAAVVLLPFARPRRELRRREEFRLRHCGTVSDAHLKTTMKRKM